MKVVEWLRVDAAFKLNMAFLGDKLTYEERLQRIEALVWMRDDIKSLIEENEYEPTIQKPADESGAAKPEKLVSGETGEWPGYANLNGGIASCGSGGHGEGGKCTLS